MLTKNNLVPEEIITCVKGIPKCGVHCSASWFIAH